MSRSRQPRQQRIALHACCGPCALEPLDELSRDADVTVVYFNPNIHPLAEYERRRDTLIDHMRGVGVEVVELDYDPAMWLERVGPHASSPERRCKECYGLRLAEVAAWAARHDCDSMSTTLTISPYQDVAAIAEEGRRATEGTGVRFVATDFRHRYPEATRRSRELGMYRQNYCGCVMSDLEARRDREQRKVERRARTAREP